MVVGGLGSASSVFFELNRPPSAQLEQVQLDFHIYRSCRAIAVKSAPCVVWLSSAVFGVRKDLLVPDGDPVRFR